MDGSTDSEEREEELSSITAIFPELRIDEHDPFSAALDITVAPTTPLRVSFPPSIDTAPPAGLPTLPTSDFDGRKDTTLAAQASDATETEAHDLSYLPPLHLQVTLPEGYPDSAPPKVALSTTPAWILSEYLKPLEVEAEKLWEEYGRMQVVFAYIDFLQQAAERAFDIRTENDRAVHMPTGMKIALLDFDHTEKRKKFEKGTFDCGVCLEPKKGSACHQLIRCGHVFCVECLRDFYGTCISEGDTSNVACLAPDCSGDPNMPLKRGVKKRTLGPSELLQIPLDQDMVKRYVELKRKKRLDSDKNTIYCPRKWCQGPAKSKKHPKITSLEDYESEEDEEKVQPSEEQGKKKEEDFDEDRLRVCEDCQYSFCRVCLKGWHGDYVRCYPHVRDDAEITKEEQATLDFIRCNTSACPTCNTACLKSHGCNHMNCFQCGTHFCYLCGFWLKPENPYQHFNDRSKPCYMRLWELEEGDDGQGAQFGGARAAEVAAVEAAREAEAAELAEREAQAEAIDEIMDANAAAREAETRATAERERQLAAAPAPQRPADPYLEPGNNRVLVIPQAPRQQPPPPGQEDQLADAMNHLNVNNNRQRNGRGRGRGGGGQNANANQNQNRNAQQARRGLHGRAAAQHRNAAAQNQQQQQAAAQGQARGGAGRQAQQAQQQQQQGRNAAAFADLQAVLVRDRGLQRFLRLAADDREDEWDSDELEFGDEELEVMERFRGGGVPNANRDDDDW